MATDFDVIILGAGFGGLGMAATLKRAGRTNFVILEQDDAIGGTWRDNVYPGAACDTESHLYCFGFDYHLSASRIYARQPELLAYADRIATDHGLRPHIRFGQRIVSADWDEAESHWRIGLADGAEVTARIFIPAWGQLNRPSVPTYPGQDDFAGIAFHSARWPTGLDLRGKRVASIGNAASAIQYIPEVAPIVDRLVVFQRSPNWIVPRGDRPYTPAELAGFADPAVFGADRQALFDWRETTFQRMLEGSSDAAEMEIIARQHLVDQVADADLRNRLLPDFPLGCKRVLRSDDYYPALMRDNVVLETAGIARFVAEGIVSTDGCLHAVDVVIYGTGFETQSFQGPVDVHGRSGHSLRDTWKDGAFAHLGVSVPSYPNLFLIYGPNTNLGHNSILSMLEAQFGYVVQAVDAILESPGKAVDVRDQVARAFDDKVQASMAGTAWAGNCTSWYKKDNGRIVNNWSGTVNNYRQLVATFQHSDYTTTVKGAR